MNFRRYFKIYVGLFIIFSFSFYLAMGDDDLLKASWSKNFLDDFSGYSDLELAEAKKISKNRLSPKKIADERSQAALEGEARSYSEDEDEIEGEGERDGPIAENTDDPRLSADQSPSDFKNDEGEKDACGSFKNIDCIPEGNLPLEKPRAFDENDNRSLASGESLIKKRRSKGDEPSDGGEKPSRRERSEPIDRVDRATRGDIRKNALIAMGTGKASTIKADLAAHASEKYIKKGSKYYGFIDERLLVYKGDKPQDMKIYVTGAASIDASRKPFALYAKASWSDHGIKIEITDCLSLDPRRLSIPCKGQVFDVIGGGSILNAKIYNPSVWGKMLQIAANLIAGSHLDEITKTISSSGEVLAFDKSQRVQRALSEAWIEAGKEAKAIFTGDRAEIASGAIVKILIREDTRLW